MNKAAIKHSCTIYLLDIISTHFQFSSVQSVSRVRLCDPMNRSTPRLPVHHKFLEFTQTHAYRVDFSKHQIAGLVDYFIRVYLVFKETVELSSKVPVTFFIPASNEWVPVAPYPHWHLTL